MKRLSFLLLLILITSLLTGQNAQKYYSKLIQDGAVVYFIKPVKFKDKQKKNRGMVDFTYLHKTKNPLQEINMKISYFANTAFPSIDSLFLKNEYQTTYRTDSIVTLFIERKKRIWKNRFECWIPFASYKTFINGQYHSVAFYINGKEYILLPKKRSWKKFKRIMQDVFFVEISLT